MGVRSPLRTVPENEARTEERKPHRQAAFLATSAAKLSVLATLNRQGPDLGTQYRSVIFYHTPEQKAAAVASKEKLDKSGKYRRPIVTEIVPASTFWRAEEYHQRYLEKRGLSSCRTHSGDG